MKLRVYYWLMQHVYPRDGTQHQPDLLGDLLRGVSPDEELV